jgi:hypothetical protein
MGRMIVQVSWPSSDALPRDSFDNTFYFTTTASPPTPTDGINAIAALLHFYTGSFAGGFHIVDYFSPFISTTAVAKCYDEDQVRAAGVARTILYQGTIARPTPGTTVPVPEEVALCISYQSAAGNAPRHRGRIYIGPLNTTALASGSDFDGTNKVSRPDPSFTGCLAAAAGSLVTSPPTGMLWCLRSGLGTGTVAAPVVEYQAIVAGHVDNEWDGQRRRRIAATTRLPLTV